MFIQSAWAAELPSVEDLLRPAEFSEVALSRDGDHLAIIAGHDYGQRVIVLNLSERSAVAGLEQEEGVYNAEPQWLSDDRVFFVTWDDDPGSFDYMNSYSRGALLDIRRHITRNLFFPFNDIIHLLPDEDRMLVLRGEEHDRRLTQVVRMHETRMRDLPEIAAAGDLRALEFIADLDGVVRGRALEEEEWGPIHIQRGSESRRIRGSLVIRSPRTSISICSDSGRAARPSDTSHEISGTRPHCSRSIF
jgi:hypothetical protein